MQALPDTCLLGSAEAEQDWIARHTEGGMDRPRLAFIEYAAPTVIYGRSTLPTQDAVRRAQARGATVLQRRTGGGAVLAGPWMLGAALLLPADCGFGKAGIVDAFRRFGAAWHTALRALQVECEEATAPHMQRHNELAAQAGLKWVCFSGLSHGELTDPTGSKLLGLAQARGKWGTLLSAGLLLQPVPWELLGWVHLGEADWRYGLASARGAAVDPGRLRAELLQALGPALQADA